MYDPYYASCNIITFDDNLLLPCVHADVNKGPYLHHIPDDFHHCKYNRELVTCLAVLPDVYYVRKKVAIIRYRLIHRYLYKHDFLCGFAVFVHKLSLWKYGTPVRSYKPVPLSDITTKFTGGGHQHLNLLRGSDLSDYVYAPLNNDLSPDKFYRLVSYVDKTQLEGALASNPNLFATQAPLDLLATVTTLPEIAVIAKYHGIKLTKRMSKNIVGLKLKGHWCSHCSFYSGIFQEHVDKPAKVSTARVKLWRKNKKIKHIAGTSKPKVAHGRKVSVRKINRISVIDTCPFPPAPADKELTRTIIENYCNDIRPEEFQESHCAVCCTLVRIKDLVDIGNHEIDLSILIPEEDMTRKERHSELDPIEAVIEPLIDNTVSKICGSCLSSLQHKKIPLMSPANGLWIGEVPEVLRNLSFAEQMLIARIRHNRCLVRVSSGRAKMIANCIMFANPTVKVYDVLPPSRQDIEEVLAFVFIGAAAPTEDDYKRTPMLVRRNNIAAALEWLKLNHDDYEDISISQENLAEYPLSGVPVSPDYQENRSGSNKIATAMSKFDNEDEDGTAEGECPFTVHGLTGAEYEKMSIDALKLRALRHLEQGGKALAVGHDSVPQTMFKNPQSYPQMFPWLFPYGKGGLSQLRHFQKISEAEHKKWLLSYYDKRFQTDLYFPIVAFNHEQIKGGRKGGMLLARRKKFDEISKRILSINSDVLDSISKRMEKGENVVPETVSEKQCFALLEDVKHVGAQVKGSLTNKKYMRNELWSLTAFLGAPQWFITFSPADNRHPLCLYYAGSDEKFTPTLKTASQRDLLVLSNPVAAAKFFDFMVKMVIKHVLGVDTNHPGLYGETAGYYGTVEQQGRLTLHLHMLLWIKNALSPQEIRNKLMNGDSIFQTSLIQYLESCHNGEFATGSYDDISSHIPQPAVINRGVHAIKVLKKSNDVTEVQKDYQDPTQTLPKPPPPRCKDHPFSPLSDNKNQADQDSMSSKCVSTCDGCMMFDMWWKEYQTTVDDLLFRSNMHKCRASQNSKGKKKKTKDADSDNEVDDIEHLGLNNTNESPIEKASRNGPKGCLDKNGNCMARFPREIRKETTVSLEDGHIFMKKLESMMNTFSYCLTYLLRCNSDVTSLLSGTSVKAVISYVTDYVTKPVLKTHQIFSSAYNVYTNDDNAKLLNDDTDPKKSATKLIVKMVNSLAAKLEIGSPMACLYLLGNPDHYTGHEFVTFWWRSYTSEIQRQWDRIDRVKSEHSDNLCEHGKYDAEDESATTDTVILGRENNNLVAMSNVDDYMYRPACYSKINLYTWIQCYSKKKCSKKNREEVKEQIAEDDNEQCSDNENWEDLDEDSAPDGYHKFMSDHPLHASFEATCDLRLCEKNVPNFVSGALPRSDRGDREFYCLTMLTLFKPWRTGLDLKSRTDTWDDAFSEHNFCDRDKKLMANFNLKYECLDARDDFHSEMKSKKKEGIYINKGSNGNMSDMDSEQENENDKDFHDYTDKTGDNIYNVLGELTNKMADKHQETMNIYKTAGWIDGAPIEPGSIDVTRYFPSIKLSPNGWKNKVKEMRDFIMRNKQSQIKVNPAADSSNERGTNTPDTGVVKVVDGDYLKFNFRAKQAEHTEITEQVSKDFKLNKEQDRAFRIIANHSAAVAPEQLKMYLGGMGGTGKTQVIKALIEVFTRRNESHRFLVLAPTGSAAALLNGSTYHSALGIIIPSGKKEGAPVASANTINEIRERILGVQYIFIDEVSMIACHEVYAISSRLSELTNIHDKPFGGLNVIFAGDFAQLPPVGGRSLYSPQINRHESSSMSVRDQESFIGKLLWQQITTVVILKQNMRQKSQTPEDAKLRTALENMRYGACTRADIDFLKTRVVGKTANRPKLSDPVYRYVSIINPLNANKDKINEIGSVKFAKDTGQTLVDFYAIDHLSNEDDGDNKVKKKGHKSKRALGCKPLSLYEKEALWNSPPSTSNHIPGKLSLCVGLPVMLRYNDATELCITKGQEATVRGWDSFKGPNGKDCLDTLYVKLTNPPKNVNIPGLEENVVPLTRSITAIQCRMPDDSIKNIQRQQVVVLPNFSMTDYASQGKTRPINVVDLSYCRGTQSYYTCLSRSASAASTVIVQAFKPDAITNGISGYLRQEFRELEMLDSITALRFRDKLPECVNGELRNNLIHSYQVWRKDDQLDKDWHQGMKWNKQDKVIKSPGRDEMWDVNLNKVAALRKAVKDTKEKAKFDNYRDRQDKEVEVETKKIKRTKTAIDQQEITDSSPIGLIWDSQNYSCAYDSLFTVLYNVWSENPVHWSSKLALHSSVMKVLSKGFSLVANHKMSFEKIRDKVRKALHNENSAHFPMGRNMTGISRIADRIMGRHEYGTITLYCPHCNYKERDPDITLCDITSISCYDSNSRRLSEILSLNSNRSIRKKCSDCLSLGITSRLKKLTTIETIPDLLMFSMDTAGTIPDLELTLSVNRQDAKLILSGLIYGNGTHFTSRIIDKSGVVWYHDGIETRSSCIQERVLTLQSSTEWLRTCNGSELVYLLYRRQA